MVAHIDNMRGDEMTKTKRVFDTVCSHSGISCHDICVMLDDSQSIISGLLSRMKTVNRIHNDNGLWYANETDNVVTIVNRLIDIHCDDNVNSGWSEGYISALADTKQINEDEFDMILKHIKQ